MTVSICFLKIIWNQAANKLEFTVCLLAEILLHCWVFSVVVVVPLFLFFLVFLNNMKGRLQNICKQ